MIAHVTGLAALAAAATLACTAPAAAQVFRSDVEGPIVTGSGIAGGGYEGGGFRDVESSLFRGTGERAVFGTPAVACAVARGAERIAAELRDGTLRQPPGLPPVQPSAETRAALLAVGVDGRTDGPEAARLRAALAGDGDAAASQGARALVEALAGLLREEGECDPTAGRWIDGARWWTAFRAYHDYLDVAPAAVLDPPHETLLTIGVVLHRLALEGLDARSG